MKKIEILINGRSSIQGELEVGLRENLAALETIRFKPISQPTPAGTLAIGGEQVVGFVIEHYDKLIPLVTAIITVLSQILARRSDKNKDKEKAEGKRSVESKPVVIVIDGNKLAFPASKESQRKFLKRLESESQEALKRMEGKKTTKKQRKNK